MPGKHVRFAASYASSSATPSPTFPTSALPSSTPLKTPPELGFGSPYCSIPLPGMPASMHPVLSLQHRPAVEYDLTLAPETMRLFAYDIPRHFWTQQAALPPVPFLKISFPGLPWHVTVHPGSTSTTGVTVGDVFAAIYRLLRTNVSKHEFARAPSDAHRIAATAAYESRVMRMHPSLRQFERAKGLKRIDFLGEHRHFFGLVPVKGSSGGWMLLVE